MKKISGIYKITNNITGDFYIGSSKNIKERWYSHRKILRWKKYPNLKLYQDMAKYGKDNFLFEIIEETDNLFKREQYWIDQLKPSYNSNRANGLDIDRIRKRKKEYYKSHYDELLNKSKEYHKEHYNKICVYNGKTLTLNALCARFSRSGIPHPVQEAKKYLLAE